MPLLLSFSMSLAEFLGRFAEVAGPVVMEAKFYREWEAEPLAVDDFPWKDPEKAARAARALFQAQGFGLAPLDTGRDGGWLVGPAAVVDRIPLPIRFMGRGARRARGRIARLRGPEVLLGDELAGGAGDGDPDDRLFAFKTNIAEGMALESFLRIAAQYCEVTCDPAAVAPLARGRKVLTKSELLIDEAALPGAVQSIVNLQGLAIVPRRRDGVRSWEVVPLREVGLGPADYETIAAEAVAGAKKRFALLSTRLTLEHVTAAEAAAALAELIRRRAPFGFVRADGKELALGDVGPQLAETVALVQALDARR